jgi:hypothetical protein
LTREVFNRPMLRLNNRIRPIHELPIGSVWWSALQSFVVSRLEAVVGELPNRNLVGEVLRYTNPAEDEPTSPPPVRIVIRWRLSTFSFQRNLYEAVVTWSDTDGEFEVLQENYTTAAEANKRKAAQLQLKRLASRIDQKTTLADVDAWRCPLCDGPLGIEFHPKGHSFVLFCRRHPHSIRQFTIDQPPAWWTNRISEEWIEHSSQT